jgi:hypothetical protein
LCGSRLRGCRIQQEKRNLHEREWQSRLIDELASKNETLHKSGVKELSIKRSQMGRFRRILKRKFARYSDFSSSTTSRLPKALTASRLVQWGLRVVLLVGMLMLLDIYAPRFFRYQNLVNILLQVSLLSLMSMGMAVVMIGGGIDLSLPANMAIGAVLGASHRPSPNIRTLYQH